MRADGRRVDELRSVSITPNYLPHAEGSALIDWGMTRLVCSASVEDRVPQHLLGTGRGWVTAEYAMLPRATTTRSNRGPSGRSSEIQRLIGRALRAAVDLRAIGTRTITIDCDVIVADGGTRTAAITGGYVALALALRRLRLPISEQIAAVSVGVVDGEAYLDLPYGEDSRAEVDMNVVMTSKGSFVEVQGTAETGAFDRTMLNRLCDLATLGVGELCTVQARALA